jgi:hypothetical protein
LPKMASARAHICNIGVGALTICGFPATDSHDYRSKAAIALELCKTCVMLVPGIRGERLKARQWGQRCQCVHSQCF